MNKTGIIIISSGKQPPAALSDGLTGLFGLPPVVVRDVVQCLEMVGDLPPRLIVVNDDPPHCDAIAILKKLKASNPALSVLVIMKNPDASSMRAAFLAGASDVITEDSFDDPAAFKEVLEGVQAVGPFHTPASDSNLVFGILDTLADAVSIQDRELRVIYQNRPHIELVGNHNGEYCYQAYSEGDEPCPDCPVLACFGDGEPHKLTKEGGRGLIVDISASPLRNRDGSVWAGVEVVRDVTERQRLVDALRNTAEGVSAQTGERFFHSLTDYLVNTLGVSTAFIGLTDENDPEISRTISFYHAGAHRNNFWYRKKGTPCGEVSERGMCVFSDGVQDTFPTIDMLKDIDARAYVGAPLVSSDGRRLGVLSVLDTKPLKDETLVESLLVIFASRVSAELDRLKVEGALRESGRRLTEMLDNIKLMAVMFDTKADITFVNGHLLDVTGWTGEEVVGRNWFEMFLPKETAADQEIRLLSMIASEDLTPHFGNEIVTRDGARREVSWSNTLIRDDSGVVVGVCCIGEDVTEMRKTERERSELFHMLTHDIKGPLSIINGYCELILSDDGTVSATTSAEEIRKASRRVFSMIEDMLTLAAMESGAMSVSVDRVDMTGLVRQSVEDMLVRADELDLTIESDLPGDGSLVVMGDGDRLRRAVDNMLINAVNYNRQGGVVRVRAGAVDGGAKMFVEVSDNGYGIPEPDLPHIFDKYFRSSVTGKKHGSGLGLAIVKGVVETSGGNVSAWNNEDGGATFRVELPTGG